MKFVKAIGEVQTLRYDSQTTIVVPFEGIIVTDDAANALATRCAVEISEAPATESEIPVADTSHPIPDVAKEPMPEAPAPVETPTIEELITNTEEVI